ncbi:MAG: acetyl-CoA carboxylase carboxyltransferase subunit beta [Chlorobi bacterium]|nr:MAG: acetyl-CoA carboxylase carboxyltransferase subunit beta [Bacteroidota bacterium]MBE2266348.1 acetyl-CoA carboxylase carboxyltransferase subunit beta [Flavobacteriales bacterium]MBL1160570.1 acetyl-CoA carboxylase carboxyltransferase subunit beta [Chlorobiota bacterium]MBW7853182.1 acetyl-CoA carboxylase carboxyltransferase subunit beta [Candidatus Kapabacteria bacterium]MCC6331329.1 acetyl-CoA carboxylase carboxyltransferase subunit beta [Ignavibacteria bacterium]
MAWFHRKSQNIEETRSVRDMPDGLWTKCPSCSTVLYRKELEQHAYTCRSCSHHFRIAASNYISILIDDGTWQEADSTVRSADPLKFSDTRPYADRLREAYNKTKLPDAVTTGTGTIGGNPVSFGCMNFGFIGGSMGSVVGEKFTRAARRSLEGAMPFVFISASGGARMQEAALSLMQMAKTSAILSELSEAGIPYISILTDPTTGGVSASYAMLGDIIIGEPKALIGFAGPRVIEQTIRKKLPEGFQRSEFLLDHGFLDMVVARTELKDMLTKIIKYLKVPNA